MRVHELKTVQPGFDDILEGRKHFEWRRNDRSFEAGDLLVLREFEPGHDGDGLYTGRAIAASVDYILYGGGTEALSFDSCVMELTVLACTLNTRHGWGQTNLRRS